MIMSICSDDISPNFFGISLFSAPLGVPSAQEEPHSGIFLTHLMIVILGCLTHPHSLPVWGFNRNPEIIRWSLKRE